MHFFFILSAFSRCVRVGEVKCSEYIGDVPLEESARSSIHTADEITYFFPTGAHYSTPLGHTHDIGVSDAVRFERWTWHVWPVVIHFLFRFLIFGERFFF